MTLALTVALEESTKTNPGKTALIKEGALGDRAS
jgi:hypothetical protein